MYGECILYSTDFNSEINNMNISSFYNLIALYSALC